MPEIESEEMYRYVKLAFTGVACVTPAYDGEHELIDGQKIVAVMPRSSFARFGLNSERTQVDALFTFGVFPLAHISKTSSRRADYIHREPKKNAKALCFFDREELTVEPDPQGDKKIVFNRKGPNDGFPKKGYTHIDWIPRWTKFADEARFREGVLDRDGSFVRVSFDKGEIAAGFTSDLTPRVTFINAAQDFTGYFAHEIVVTLRYPKEQHYVTLKSRPFYPECMPTMTSPLSPPSSPPEPPEVERPRDLVLEFGDADTIKVTIANGSLDSINSVLRDGTGREHRGRVDFEFGVIYDVLTCAENPQFAVTSESDTYPKLPLPQIDVNEIRPVPCLSSMV